MKTRRHNHDLLRGLAVIGAIAVVGGYVIARVLVHFFFETDAGASIFVYLLP